MAIKRETIEHLKSLIDIYEVIGDFVDLKKSGANYKAHSPFSNEKTPSFFVVPQKNIFKCFSSGKGGDAITFIMELEGLSYIEALRFLAKKYNVELEEEEATPEEILQNSERESLFIILNYAKDFYKKALIDSEEGQSIGLSYFKERGFTEETIADFDLGYSLNQWEAFFEAAKKDQYDEELLVKAGLIVKKEESGKVYDRFRTRVMFPIHNLTGKVIAFGARMLGNEKNQPKYINSPETSIYHKSKVLYGLFQAKQAIRQQDACLLVEGYTDVISLHQAGIKNVVASSGTALTEDQISLIGRYTKNITVLFDGDAAGVLASMRGIDMILEKGMNVKAVSLPEGEDPDSLVKSLGKEVFNQFLDKEGKDFISFKTDIYLKEADADPIKRASVIKEIVSSIAKIPDGITRSLYFKDCAKKLDIEEEVLIKEFNKTVYKKRGDTRSRELYRGKSADVEQSKPTVEKTDNLRLQEKEIIRILINYAMVDINEEKKLLEYLLSEINDVSFKTPIYNKMMKAIKEEAQPEDSLVDFFITHSDKEIREEAVDILTDKYHVSDNWLRHEIIVPKEHEILSNVITTTVYRLKFRSIQQMIKENKELIMNAKSDDDVGKFQKIHLQLKKAERDIANVLGNVISN